MEKLLQDIDVKHRIRDPIYGFIHLSDAEMRIVDTPLFQRLRRVHQLALTKYVYPSAEHSRFVHSLGVMHCATLILSGVMNHKYTKTIYEYGNRAVKTLRFAALLHDIGHLPFSHAVERQWLDGLKHEDLSQFIIEHYPPIRDVLESEEVDPRDVASVLAKKPPAHLNLIHEVVSGELDADRADYLLRDSHSCGVRYGEYDFHRFLQIFAADENPDAGALSLVVDESDLHVAESLLIARYHYNLQIPYHKTRSGYDEALKRFVRGKDFSEDIFRIDEGRIHEVNWDGFAYFDDYCIMEKVKQAHKDGDGWAKYLLREKHLVPVFDVLSTSEIGAELFKRLVRALRNSQEFEEDEDFFVQTDTMEIIKRSKSPDLAEGATDVPAPRPSILLYSKEGKGRSRECIDISERSWIFKELTKNLEHKDGDEKSEPLMVLRVFVIPEKAEAVRSLLQSLEGESREQ
jgi:hypothetical protein